MAGRKMTTRLDTRYPSKTQGRQIWRAGAHSFSLVRLTHAVRNMGGIPDMYDAIILMGRTSYLQDTSRHVAATIALARFNSHQALFTWVKMGNL